MGLIFCGGGNLNGSEEQKEAQKMKADGKPILPQLEIAMLKRESRSVSAEAKLLGSGNIATQSMKAKG